MLSGINLQTAILQHNAEKSRKERSENYPDSKDTAGVCKRTRSRLFDVDLLN